MKKIKTVCMLVVLLVLWAQSAWALDMEFYTYGGFDLMVQAFNFIALIFSDINYKGLLYVFAIFGIVGGAISFLVASASGNRVVPLFWVVQVFAGAVIYLAMFVPTGNIAIYDATLNKTQTIGGIPNAVIFVAGCLNKLERGIVSICDTAASPISTYSGNAGGIGFDLLQNMSNAQDIYATMSMGKYIDNCVLFETMRPGGTIGFDELTGDTTDFLTTLAKAQNPAIFTLYYDSANTGGVTMTCTEAWNKLQPFYSSVGNYDDALEKTCSNNMDASDPAEIAICKSMISNTVNLATGTNYTYDTILRQSQISAMLYHTFMGNPQTSAALQADRSITSSGFGMGITMNEWIPIIKSILTAIAISLVPFLTLLLPTPLIGKVISAMFGFFVFLTVWGVTDVIMHSGAVVYAANSFREIGPDNLGMLAMANMPTLSAKTLAMFGIVRGSGLMMAAMLTGMLVRFGGTALAHLARSLARVTQLGGELGGKQFTPEGRSAEQEELLRAWGSMSVESQERFANRGAALAMERMRKVESANNALRVARQAEAMGQVAPGTAESLKGVARMGAGQQNLSTDQGIISAVVGPDGGTNMLEEAGINADGSRSDISTGAGGTGIQNDITQTSSRLSYTVDATGGRHLTSASITGLDAVKMTNTAMQMKIEGASHALSHDRGFTSALSEGLSVGGSDAVSRAQSDSFRTSFAANFDRNIGESSDFAKDASWSELKTVRGFLSGHGGLSVGGVGGNIGADGTLTLQGKDGHTFNTKVSEATARALRNAQESAFNETVATTANTHQGANWLSSAAERMGNSEAYSLLNEARDMSRSQQSFGTTLTAPFLEDFARHHFGGSTSPEALRFSADYLSNMVNRNGAAGERHVEGMVQGWMRRSGYGDSGTPAAIRQDISSWGGQATGGVPAGGQSAISRARTETGSVKPDSFRNRDLGHTGQGKGIENQLNDNSWKVIDGQKDRAATDRYNVEQGGRVLGNIKKRPQTEQESVTTQRFRKDMNRFIQQVDKNSRGGGNQ